MTAIAPNLPAARLQPLARGPFVSPREGRMYAIAFDMDIESLREHYGDPYNNAYLEIRRVLQKHGFQWQQGSVYFGGAEVNAVTCVLAAVELSRTLSWFAASVRDIRMLRIEELNDLMPAIEEGRQPSSD
jgi:virulence-associated protein VapD